jgi:uncharacterized spore protein YtfJ
MGPDDEYLKQPGFRVATVRGEPYHVAGRKLIPVARILSFGKARATIRADQVSGWGMGFVRITPLAVVEETEEGERCISVIDETGVALRGMLGGAVAILLIFTTIRWLSRHWRKAGGGQG